MRNIPVDTSAMNLVYVATQARKEGMGSDAKQRINNDGQALWTIQVVSQSSMGNDEDQQAEMTNLTLPGEKPNLDPFTPIEADNLMARFWQMPNGNAGVSFSATAIRPKRSANSKSNAAPSVPAS